MRRIGGESSLRMRVLLVGDWAWPQYEEAFARGLRQNHVEVFPFELPRTGNNVISKAMNALSLPTPQMLVAHLQLIFAARNSNPDLILFWRPTRLSSKIVSSLSKTFFCASYNNDDPFGPKVHNLAPWHHKLLWGRYLASLKYFHVNLFYRPVNVTESYNYGSKISQVLMPYFDPERDKPWTLRSPEKEKYSSDVTFIGHYEQDGRDSLIMKLVEAGVDVKLFGSSEWRKSKEPKLLETFGDIKPLRGDDYAKATSGAKISLAFLSKLNRDRYTRRCFEIPAIGGLLLAERTPELMEMFLEDQEACFFEGEEELLSKVRWLLENQIERDRIAKAGQKRVWKDGHDLKSRAAQFIKMSEELIDVDTQP